MISKEGFILGKEEFVDYLNFIKDQYKKQDTLISAFETLCPGHYCDTYIYEEYEAHLIKLLQSIMNDKDDDIGIFMYEVEYIDHDLDKINKAWLPTGEDGKPLYASPETLYDYLISKK